MSPEKRYPLYLFYGTHVAEILKARDGVVQRVLPEDESRNENLTEYAASSPTAKIELAKIYDEMAGDLETLSFVPDAPKCVVVTNPAELFASGAGGAGGARGSSAGSDDDGDSGSAKLKGKGKAGAGGALLHWLEHDLPATPHTIVMLAFEDEAAQLEVNARTPLYQLLLKIGFAQRFASGEKAFFRIEGAIMRRDLGECIAAIRELWASPKGEGPAYNSVVRTLRLLMQANIARERKALQDPAAQNALFPPTPQFNLFKASPNVTRKYTSGGALYRTADLIEAYRGALDVYRAMRPRPDDLYVPDKLGLLEQTLVKLITTPRPRA